MSDLKFHPKAFSLIWDMPPMTPAEHVEAFGKMIDEWHAEREALLNQAPKPKPNGGTK
jgi:hypothetical protein